MTTTPWRKSDLNVSYEVEPGRESYVYEMGTTSRETLSFDAGQAITAGAAAMFRLDTFAAAPDTIEAVSNDGQVVAVTVSGLERGVTYALIVTLTATAGERTWPRVLFLDCVI